VLVASQRWSLPPRLLCLQPLPPPFPPAQGFCFVTVSNTRLTETPALGLPLVVSVMWNRETPEIGSNAGLGGCTFTVTPDAGLGRAEGQVQQERGNQVR
jgi:hypothetical protein